MSKGLSAKHYQNNQERLQKKLVKKVFLKKKKKKKRQYSDEQYRNLREDEKQKFVEYRKNIIK